MGSAASVPLVTSFKFFLEMTPEEELLIQARLQNSGNIVLEIPIC